MAQVVASDEAVAELARAIDGLLALELHDLSDDDLSRLVVELEVQRSRLGGVGAAVVRAFDRRGRWALERDEGMLVGQAKELSLAEFHQAVTYWEQLADPDGGRSRAGRSTRKGLTDMLSSMFPAFRALPGMAGIIFPGSLPGAVRTAP